MEGQEIVEELRRQNEWWREEEVNLPENLVRRGMSNKVQAEIEEDIITALTGLRRAGKTTLLKTVISDLLEETDPDRIMYFSLDLADEIDIKSIIDTYTEEVLSEPLEEAEDRIYIFLDEVQKLDNWADHVKSIQDRDYNVKFVVTGSASTNITKGAGESLVGRIIIHRLHTFSFRDYLKYEEIDTPQLDLENPSYPENARKLKIKFNEYMEKGGFPELYEEQTVENLRQNLDLTLFRDIVNISQVKRTDTLKQLFRLTAENTGQVVNYNNFSNHLDTQYRTVTDYLQYLEDGFLIENSQPVFSNQKKSMRKNPKIYIADHAYNQIYNTKTGLKAETIAYNHIKRTRKPGYKKQPEVDIILEEEKKAFEIKYTENPQKQDTKQLTKLPEQYQLYLVTKQKYEEWKVNNRKIQLIPLWQLCLLS